MKQNCSVCNVAWLNCMTFSQLVERLVYSHWFAYCSLINFCCYRQTKEPHYVICVHLWLQFMNTKQILFYVVLGPAEFKVV